MLAGIGDLLCDRAHVNLASSVIVGVEHLRHRTVLLGLAGDLGETGVVEVRHLGAQGQCRLADLEALAFRLERDGGFVESSVGVKPARLKAEGQRHREAAGMGRRDQLLGIGALLVLEAGLERIGRLGEHAGFAGEMAGAVAAGALPDCFCLADHLNSPCCSLAPALGTGGKRHWHDRLSPSNRSSAAAVPLTADLSDVEAQPVLDVAGAVETARHQRLDPGLAARDGRVRPGTRPTPA